MTMQTRLIQQDDRLIIANSQDCTPIAEQAKALHNAGEHGSSEMKHAARIPQVMVEKYCHDNGITFQTFMNDPAHIKRMLNDPANEMFRIWKGRV
jgi:hypothetical protein